MKRALSIFAAFALTGTLAIPSAWAGVVNPDNCTSLGVHLTGVAPISSCWSWSPSIMSTGEDRLNGITDWVFGQSLSFGPSGKSLETELDLGLDATSGTTGGSWSMNADALGPFAYMLMMFRSGETYFSYLLDGPSPDGAWASTDGQAIDEVLVLVAGSATTDAPTAVPLPASLAFLFGGFGALGLIARRRRTAAA